MSGPHTGTPAAGDDHLALIISAANAESVDQPLLDLADSDGHLISGSVFRQRGGQTPLAPVKIRVSHGCAASTAASMLRKAADLIEADPSILSASPGSTLRRQPDGSAVRRKVTEAGLIAAADDLDDTTRARLFGMLDQIRSAIRDDDPPLGEPGTSGGPDPDRGPSGDPDRGAGGPGDDPA